MNTPRRPTPDRVVVVAIALVTFLVVPTTLAWDRLAGRSDAPPYAEWPSVVNSTPPPSTAPATAGPAATTTTVTPSVPGRAETTTPPPRTSFAYQPLFPFASLEEARAWQRAFPTDGHQPWHLDPKLTALAFVGYLGYSEIDRITSHTGDNTDAEVGVGYEIVEGRTATAAIVHLVRFGSGVDAPWEVVGTADTDLTLTTPRYGATVASPITVGGHITGVDEAIHVQVRQLSSADALGQSCCLAAGGQRSPWQAAVSFAGATDRVLTVSVSTGGHLKRVERFAVTAVKVS